MRGLGSGHGHPGDRERRRFRFIQGWHYHDRRLQGRVALLRDERLLQPAQLHFRALPAFLGLGAQPYRNLHILPGLGQLPFQVLRGPAARRFAMQLGQSLGHLGLGTQLVDFLAHHHFPRAQLLGLTLGLFQLFFQRGDPGVEFNSSSRRRYLGSFHPQLGQFGLDALQGLARFIQLRLQAAALLVPAFGHTHQFLTDTGHQGFLFLELPVQSLHLGAGSGIACARRGRGRPQGIEFDLQGLDLLCLNLIPLGLTNLGGLQLLLQRPALLVRRAQLLPGALQFLLQALALGIQIRLPALERSQFTFQARNFLLLPCLLLLLLDLEGRGLLLQRRPFLLQRLLPVPGRGQLRLQLLDLPAQCLLTFLDLCPMGRRGFDGVPLCCLQRLLQDIHFTAQSGLQGRALGAGRGQRRCHGGLGRRPGLLQIVQLRLPFLQRLAAGGQLAAQPLQVLLQGFLFLAQGLPGALHLFPGLGQGGRARLAHGLEFHLQAALAPTNRLQLLFDLLRRSLTCGQLRLQFIVLLLLTVLQRDTLAQGGIQFLKSGVALGQFRLQRAQPFLRLLQAGAQIGLARNGLRAADAGRLLLLTQLLPGMAELCLQVGKRLTATLQGLFQLRHPDLDLLQRGPGGIPLTLQGVPLLPAAGRQCIEALLQAGLFLLQGRDPLLRGVPFRRQLAGTRTQFLVALAELAQVRFQAANALAGIFLLRLAVLASRLDPGPQCVALLLDGLLLRRQCHPGLFSVAQGRLRLAQLRAQTVQLSGQLLQAAGAVALRGVQFTLELLQPGFILFLFLLQFRNLLAAGIEFHPGLGQFAARGFPKLGQLLFILLEAGLGRGLVLLGVLQFTAQLFLGLGGPFQPRFQRLDPFILGPARGLDLGLGLGQRGLRLLQLRLQPGLAFFRRLARLLGRLDGLSSRLLKFADALHFLLVVSLQLTQTLVAAGGDGGCGFGRDFERDHRRAGTAGDRVGRCAIGPHQDRGGYRLQATLQDIDIQSALAQHEGAGRTAAAGITAEDEATVLLQAGGGIAQTRQRDVARARNGAVLEFTWQAHIQPDRAIFGEAGGLFIANLVHQGGLQQFLEVLLGQAHQGAIGQHGDGGVALVVGYQRVLAKAGAIAQFGQFYFLALRRGLAGHHATAIGNDVEIVALIPLADDHLAGANGQGLHFHQQLLDIGRRQLHEGRRLEHPGHPVVFVAAVDFIDFVARGFVPGQQDVEQAGVDVGHSGIGLGARRNLARLLVADGVAGVVVATDHAPEQLIIVANDADFAIQYIDGLVVAIPPLEDEAPGADLLDDRLCGDLVHMHGRQRIEGDQVPQRFFVDQFFRRSHALQPDAYILVGPEFSRPKRAGHGISPHPCYRPAGGIS